MGLYTELVKLNATLDVMRGHLSCLSSIVEVMRDRSLPDDLALSEIQDYLTMAGFDVPLRSYRFDAPKEEP